MNACIYVLCRAEILHSTALKGDCFISACLCFECRPIIEQYGLWDTLRVDHGKEWTLMLFVQEQIAHLRGNCGRAPHLQTTSKQVGSNYNSTSLL